MIFEQIKVGTSIIPQFDVILTGQSICGTNFMIQGHLQGQKVNSMVKKKKKKLFSKYK